MKILSFSYCFPNKINKNWGIFVYNRLKAMSKKADLKACSPVPTFPLIASGKDLINYEEEDFQQLDVFRPGFFYFPKIFKNRDAFFYSMGIRQWFSELLKDWRPDLLDAHFIWPDGVGVSHLAKEFNLPYSITLRGKIYESIKIESQRIQCSKALKGASKIISVSGKMAEEAVKLGASESKIEIIPNGVDKDNFKPKDKQECRKYLNLPKDKRILTTIAHLGHRKGHYEVIEALKDLPKDIILVLVGGDVQGGKALKLMKKAKSYGLGERLFITGPKPYEKIPFYFGASDASVLASYREGCPNAVLESLGCGVPVIATDVGAIPDLIKSPETGEIVPLFSVEALSAAIEKVLDRNIIRSQVLEKSGVRSWSEVAEDVLSCFRSI